MKVALITLSLIFSECFIFKGVVNAQSYTLYPYAWFADTVNFSSVQPLIAIRSCNNNSDTQYIMFNNLVGLKFNEYKSLNFKQFDTAVIRKIYNRECLSIYPMQEYSLIISSKEYNSLNPDSLYKKYFKDGVYGRLDNPDDTTVPTRDFWVALLILFDNKYIIKMSEFNYSFVASKAWTDDEIKRRNIKLKQW